jgi:hypothetical protein
MTHAKTPLSGLTGLLRLPAVAMLGILAPLSAETALVSNSPFSPTGTVGVAGAAASNEAYELAGTSIQGSSVSVCIFEKQAQRSQWIPVGGDMDGVHVVSYNAAADTVVVTVSGARKELSMRKMVVASSGAAPVPKPVAMNPVRIIQPEGGSYTPNSSPAPAPAPSAPAGPAAAVQDQKEARMLVSDLLEIGVQQRKAFQDAKQKAAAAPAPQQSN